MNKHSRVVRAVGERELDILQVLWRLGGGTVAEVRADLAAGGDELAYNTVQTLLNRLEGKGVVKRQTVDRAHRYVPRTKEPAVVSGAIRRLADRFFGGSAEALTMRLMQEHLTPEQLAHIQTVIEGYRAEQERES
ncbi:MAG TPA: BlaI/MecI/CopY family transcriptional regulator [Thermoanaerobaculia bacterium]|nr:BlaI/MecI/CopY family transcriptional regulator [Thermoanaerobaculia bacterium]